jgi:hypothetical protein
MEVTVGKSYRCKAIGIENEVSGVVMNKYENTVMVLVEEHHACDRPAILDKQQRVIVKNEDVLSEVGISHSRAS